MRKFLFAFILFVAAFSVKAQDTIATPSKAAKQTDLDKKFSKFSKDRIAIDLLGANWIYNPNGAKAGGLRTKWFSRGLNIAFFWDFRIKHSRVSVAPGIDYSIYTINSRSQMTEDSAGIHFSPLTNESNYKVNSLTLQYIDIPVELRIRSNPDKFDNMWKVCIGVKAGIRIDAHTKQTIRDVHTSPGVPSANTTKVEVLHKYPDFSPFRFGPTLRVGYSIFNITAYYGVINVFKPGRGPKANEFTVGLSINGL